QVRTQALDLRGHARLRALADGHQQHYGSHPDDDPEHRQRRAHFVAADGAKGVAYVFQNIHRFGVVEAVDPLLVSLLARCSMSPSCMRMIRCAKAATRGSWVTITIVFPSRLSWV